MAGYRAFLREKVFADRTDLPPGVDAEVGIAPVTISGLFERFLDYAVDAYPGKHSEYANVRLAVNKFLAFAGESAPITSIGPRLLKDFQNKLAKGELKRGYINSLVTRVKRAFEWGVSEEIVAPAIHQALSTVPGLRAGRTKAKETEAKKPVSRKDLDDVLKYLSGPTALMAEVQWYTGARSDSICHATAEQFDRSVNPWLWRPKHKTQRLGKEVVLPIGPRCQAILKPLMKKKGYLFSPRDVRKNSRYGERYDSNHYGQAVSRAIDKANEERRKKKRREIEYWSPHVLRHTKGTNTREQFDVETAQAILGHASIRSTEIYSQAQLKKAKKAAKKHG